MVDPYSAQRHNSTDVLKNLPSAILFTPSSFFNTTIMAPITPSLSLPQAALLDVLLALVSIINTQYHDTITNLSLHLGYPSYL